MDVDGSLESRKDLRDIEIVSETDLQGSRLLRDLHILVCLFLLKIQKTRMCFRGRVLNTLTMEDLLSSSESPRKAGLLETLPVKMQAPIFCQFLLIGIVLISSQSSV